MSVLNTILEANGGQSVETLARRFGVSDEQARAAMRELVPALNAGVKRNVQDTNGLSSLLGALGNGGHERYLDDPKTLEAESTMNEGNAILGHIFGSKEVSRSVAGNAASRTGLDVGILKQMLPYVATMLMGSLKKQSTNQGWQNNAAAAPGFLTKMLDADGDGSIMDDVWNMAKKLLG